MPDGLYIDASQLNEGVKAFEELIKALPQQVDLVLNKSAEEITTRAKDRAPADRGQLRQTISPDKSKPLEKHITAHMPYAAYIEFGTGKLAAQQVSSYPAEYQTYAAQFKGAGGGGNFDDMILLIKEWIKRKGIDVFAQREEQYDESGNVTYQRKKRRTKGEREAKLDQVAYFISRSIMIKGVHPHPFLIPALIDQEPILKQDMQNLLNKMKT